ncbi:MAG: putative quinol monooxygenase [Anaerolineae bacterium]
MIIRLVSMKFKPEHADDFRALFEATYPRIRRLPGCTFLQLVADPDGPADFMTISHWRDTEDLEAYRDGELFGEVWPQVKAMMRDKPWARSYQVVAGDDTDLS